MNKEYTGFFDRITPESSSEEFLRGVLRKAEKMENNKKRSFGKRPIIIAAAAAATLSVGVSAAAATGLLSFNNIFGSVITAESETMADNLISEPKGFRFAVSDEDYTIVPKGVTGGTQDFIAAFDIVRTDGQPVSDFLFTQPESGRLAIVNETWVQIDEPLNYAGGLDAFDVTFNEDGNISVVVAMHYSIDITGETVRIFGSDLYELDKLLEFQDSSAMHTDFIDDNGEYIYRYDMESGRVYDSGFLTDNEYKLINLEQSDILLHELDWSVEFEYTQAISSLKAADLSRPFTDAVQVDLAIDELPRDQFPDATETVEVEAVVQDIDITSVMGSITYKLGEELLKYPAGKSMVFSEPQVELITDSGGRIKAEFNGSSCYEDADGLWLYQLSVKFCDNDGSRIAVDLSEISAVSINDVVYELQ